MLAKLFANTVFLIRNVFVVLSQKTCGYKKAFCEIKPSPVIAYNLNTRKKQHKNGDFRSMSFKELAFFADVKRKVFKTHRHTIIAQRLWYFTQVRAFLLCLKTFEFRFILHAKNQVFFS